MRINFICHDLGRNGGTIDIIELANALTDRGHEVNVIYPKYVFPNIFNKKLSLPMSLMRLQRELRGKNPSDKFRARCKILKVKRLTDKYIPDADFVFATWWETAKYVQKLSPSKGKKCYYIQHHETWGGRKKAVKDTYKLPFKQFVHSEWLKTALIPNQPYLIPHAPSDVFKKLKVKKDKSQKTILLISRKEKWKGTFKALFAYEFLQKRLDTKAKLWIVGERPIYIPDGAEYLGYADQEELCKLYNLADIFLFTSYHEGFGLPPLEAMKCGCAVSTTNVGAVPDYGVHCQNLVISRHDPIDMVEGLKLLLEDDKWRQDIAKKGYETAKKYTWKNTAKQYEEVLEQWVR